MERFFFELADGADHPDDTGSRWPTLEAAKSEAVRLSGEILREMPERFLASDRWTMTVRNEARRPIFELTLHSKSFT